jgi:hypothetical protein
MTQPFRVHIREVGNGYLAENDVLSISVGGSSPAEAAEKARSLAVQLLACHLREALPATFMARIDTVDYVAFVMRPFSKPFELSPDDPETVYVDSAGRSKVHQLR